MVDPGKPSRTAIVTCLMRALHSRFDRPALIDDTWADQLVLSEERSALARTMLAAMDPQRRDALASADANAILHQAWHGTSVYAGVILRTRYAEETVAAAAMKGVRQYVIIGAGLDSFAMRQGAEKGTLHVFEVDHPASQQLKQSRLAACGVSLPDSLHFVPADLSCEELGAALRRSDFRFDEPAVMSWLGVTVYLTREANFATLRSIAQFASPGSELVFTYVERRALDSDAPAMQRAKAYAAAIGEPWICGFDSSSLPQELKSLGLELIEDLGRDELHSRYCAAREDSLAPGRAGRFALTRVAEKIRDGN